MNAVGLDIGGTKIYAAYGEDKSLRHILRFPTPQDMTSFLKQLEQIILLYDREKRIDGIGIGIAGAKGADGKLWAPNIPCLTGIDVGRLIETRFGLKTVVANDAHAALIGEKWAGCVQDVQNAVLVSIGTGIGGALLFDGKVVSGEHGAAGAVGWLPFSCGCSGTDMLHYEEAASGNALDALARQNGTFQNGEALIDAYRKGVPEAKKRFTCWASSLGYGIASIASIMDAAVIILTGGLVKELDCFGMIVQERIEAFASPLNQTVKVCASALGDKACLYGAVRLGQTKTTNKRRYL